MPKPFETTDADFDEKVLKSELPVLVDFWAEWCGPCKMIAPIVEELSEEYEGMLNFAKLDVDSNPKTPINYGIRGIPAMLIFNGGSVAKQVVGAVPKASLKKSIDEAIAG